MGHPKSVTKKSFMQKVVTALSFDEDDWILRDENQSDLIFDLL